MTPIASVHAATLHDAFQRAQRVAPTKGAAFDRAAGFHLTFEESSMTIRATDLEVSYIQSVDAEVTESAVLRLPSTTLAAFVGSLPMSGDQSVFFIKDGEQVIVRYGKTKTKAKLNPIRGEFPSVEWHPLDAMRSAHDLSSRIDQVAWATEDHGVLSGVRIDGTHLLALSHRRAARVACAIAWDPDMEPVVAVLSSLAPLIKLGTDIRMAVIENKIVLALDDRTQIKSTVLLGDWPDLLERLEEIPMTGSFQVAKQRWIDGLSK